MVCGYRLSVAAITSSSRVTLSPHGVITSWDNDRGHTVFATDVGFVYRSPAGGDNNRNDNNSNNSNTDDGVVIKYYVLFVSRRPLPLLPVRSSSSSPRARPQPVVASDPRESDHYVRRLHASVSAVDGTGGRRLRVARSGALFRGTHQTLRRQDENPFPGGSSNTVPTVSLN